MYYMGEGRYALSVVMPFAGEYTYAVSTYGTLSAVYTEHSRRAASGDGPRAKFIITRKNSVVRFTFRFMEGAVKVEIIE